MIRLPISVYECMTFYSLLFCSSQWFFLEAITEWRVRL